MQPTSPPAQGRQRPAPKPSERHNPPRRQLRHQEGHRQPDHQQRKQDDGAHERQQHHQTPRVHVEPVVEERDRACEEPDPVAKGHQLLGDREAADRQQLFNHNPNNNEEGSAERHRPHVPIERADEQLLQQEMYISSLTV